MHEVGVDGAIEFVTCIVAVRYDSWPLLVASMASVLSVATDAAELLNPLHRWAYFTALFTRNYIYLAALAAGAWTSWRRRRAGAQLTAA